MAKTPTPVITKPYPSGMPVARYNGPTAQPPTVTPTPGKFSSFKSGLPNLPRVTQLFHKPRKAGN